MAQTILHLLTTLALGIGGALTAGLSLPQATPPPGVGSETSPFTSEPVSFARTYGISRNQAPRSLVAQYTMGTWAQRAGSEAPARLAGHALISARVETSPIMRYVVRVTRQAPVQRIRAALETAPIASVVVVQKRRPQRDLTRTIDRLWPRFREAGYPLCCGTNYTWATSTLEIRYRGATRSEARRYTHAISCHRAMAGINFVYFWYPDDIVYP